MKVLITGAAGFIGYHLCKKLLAENHQIIGLDNFCSGERKNIVELQQHPNFDFFEKNIAENFESLLTSKPIHQIYHLACPASPKFYQKSPIDTLMTSVLGSKNILDIALQKKARILFSSTSEIYGDSKAGSIHEQQLGWTSTVSKRSCYIEGKRCAESLFYNYHLKYNLDICMARIFNCYGPNMRPNDGRVIPSFIANALHNKPLKVYGQGQQTRSFCFIDDLIQGLIRFMNLEKSWSHPINLGRPEELDILCLAKKIKTLTQSKSDIIFCELPEGDPQKRRPNINAALEHLNWSPQISLEQGLKQTIRYYQRSH